MSTTNGPGRISVRTERALMPGSKTPKPPACQIQAWFGVPAPHVLLPDDRDGAGPAAGEPGLCLRHRGREARMPGGEEDGALLAGGGDHEVDLAQRRRRRLLQQHVAPGRQRLQRHGGARLGRHAERDGRRRALGEEAVEIGEVRHARRSSRGARRRRRARSPGRRRSPGCAGRGRSCRRRPAPPGTAPPSVRIPARRRGRGSP